MKLYALEKDGVYYQHILAGGKVMCTTKLEDARLYGENEHEEALRFAAAQGFIVMVLEFEPYQDFLNPYVTCGEDTEDMGAEDTDTEDEGVEENPYLVEEEEG